MHNFVLFLMLNEERDNKVTFATLFLVLHGFEVDRWDAAHKLHGVSLD